MTVKLYSTPSCPYCRLVEDFFKERKIEYTEIDVSQDHAAATEMVKMSGQMGVPVIDVDGKIIVGWNKSALEEALEPRKKKSVAMAA